MAIWGGLTFVYTRDFLKSRRERKEVLPLLKTWRPRKRWIVRFLSGWRDALRSPVFVVYIGMLSLALVAQFEADLPYGRWLLLIPGGAVLWGLWGWIFGRGKPPIDTEL